MILKLPYRPPLAWAALTRFLVLRAASGVETVDGNCYRRAVRLGDVRGGVAVCDAADEHHLLVDACDALAPVQTQLVARLRQVFDLDADPGVIDAHLRRDPRLRASVGALPGLRVPGAFGDFELALRTVIGQQISVRAATTVYGRFAARFGERLEPCFGGVSHTAPIAAQVAAAPVEDIAALGVPKRRAQTIRQLARAFDEGVLQLQPGDDPDAACARLVAMPGIGEWTARYLAMRVLRDADAFPAGDLGIQRALAVNTAREAEAVSQAWRPWRAYAVMHLWQAAAGG